jgi:hypothetical protein
VGVLKKENPHMRPTENSSPLSKKKGHIAPTKSPIACSAKTLLLGNSNDS